jgi:SPP1 gp7 family putative phage head morphogenesis protein
VAQEHGKLIDLQCEACARELEAMYILVASGDDLVAKALVLSEVAQIAKAELRIQELLTAAWQQRSKQAALRAGGLAGGGKSASTIELEIRRVMKKWQTDVSRPFSAVVKKIYKLARVAGHKKATKQSKLSLQYTSAMVEELDVTKADDEPVATALLLPRFDLLDESAIEMLQDDQMLWIGRHYDSNVRDVVREVARDVQTRGLGRREAAVQMMAAVREALGHVRIPGGFTGTDKQYFEGLAANTATNARVRGQLRSFVDIGITIYELVNPMDYRTSEICAHLNGKQFAVQDAVSQVESEAGATSPDQVKEAHPWLSYKDILAISPTAGQVSAEDSRALAAEGVMIPPFHFRCRTTIDISRSHTSFSDLSGAPAAAPRPAPTASTVDSGLKTAPPRLKAPPGKRPATMPVE